MWSQSTDEKIVRLGENNQVHVRVTQTVDTECDGMNTLEAKA